MSRINIFHNFPDQVYQSVLLGNGRFYMHEFYVPGSISFNNVVFAISNNSAAHSITYSIGLYSLSGSTLSLANSAEGSFAGNGGFSWRTLATSAVQDITPGDWFLGFLYSTNGGGGSVRVLVNSRANFSGGEYGGPFFGGVYSATTNVFPSSIDTTNMSKGDGTGNSLVFPHIIISA